MGVVNIVLKPFLVERHSYAMEEMCGWEKNINRITACEMKFFWRTADYIKWDHERNEDILD